MTKVVADILDKNLEPEIKKEIQKLKRRIATLESRNQKLKAQLSEQTEKLEHAETVLSIAERIVEYCHECANLIKLFQKKCDIEL